MKNIFAVAVAALFVAPLAFAEGDHAAPAAAPAAAAAPAGDHAAEKHDAAPAEKKMKAKHGKSKKEAAH